MIIKDREHTLGCCLSHPAAMYLISNRIYINVKKSFISKIRSEERNILEVRTEYNDGLKRVAASKLAQLKEKLEEFYIEME